MSIPPAALTPSAPPSVTNLRLSEALTALAPAVDSIDAETRKRAHDLLRETPGIEAGDITSYGEARVLTLDQELAMLSRIRGKLAAGTPVADLLDREIEIRSQEQKAIACLHEAFFRGHVIVSGVKKGAADRQHRRILSSYFSNARAIVWSSNEIRQSASAVAQTRAVQGDEFDDVLVDAQSFDRWRQGAGALAAQPSTSAGSANNIAKKQIAVRAAVAALWPNGIPTDLMAKDRNKQILDWCVDQHGHSRNALPSTRTIVRTLKSPTSA